MYYTSLCTRPNGEVIKTWASDSLLEFVGLGRFSIPTQPLWLTTAATNTTAAAIGQAHTGGYAMVVRQDGQIINMGPAHGVFCTGLKVVGATLIAVWVNPDGQDYSEQDITGGPITVRPVELPWPGGTSQGFIGFLPDGTPRWTDLYARQTVNDYVVTLSSTLTNGTVIGQSNNFYGVTAVSPTGVAYKVMELPAVQTPPQGAVYLDSSMVVCVAYDAADPLSLFVPSSAWVPLETQPPVDPPIEPPVDPPVEPPIEPEPPHVCPPCPELPELASGTIVSVLSSYANGDVHFIVRAKRKDIKPNRGQAIQFVK